MSDDLVTVVIVNFETSTYVRRCLDSLHGQPQSHQIVVVDNASPAEDWRNLQIEHIRLIRSPENVGYGLACNLGAHAAGEYSQFICILNPDTQVPAGMLARWVDNYKQLLPNGGILGPRLLNENGVAQRSAYRFPGFWSYWANHSLFAGVIKTSKKRRRNESRTDTPGTGHQQVDWIMGSAMLIDRPTWNALGGFSKEYFLYAEDMDLCYRCHRLARPVIYDGSIILIHTQGDPAPGQRHIALERLFAGLKTFLNQHYGPAKRATVKLAVMLDMAMRVVVLGSALAMKPHNLLLQNRFRGAINVLKMFARS